MNIRGILKTLFLISRGRLILCPRSFPIFIRCLTALHLDAREAKGDEKIEMGRDPTRESRLRRVGRELRVKCGGAQRQLEVPQTNALGRLVRYRALEARLRQVSALLGSPEGGVENHSRIRGAGMAVEDIQMGENSSGVDPPWTEISRRSRSVHRRLMVETSALWPTRALPERSRNLGEM